MASLSEIVRHAIRVGCEMKLNSRFNRGVDCDCFSQPPANKDSWVQRVIYSPSCTNNGKSNQKWG